MRLPLKVIRRPSELIHTTFAWPQAGRMLKSNLRSDTTGVTIRAFGSVNSITFIKHLHSYLQLKIDTDKCLKNMNFDIFMSLLWHTTKKRDTKKRQCYQKRYQNVLPFFRPTFSFYRFKESVQEGYVIKDHVNVLPEINLNLWKPQNQFFAIKDVQIQKPHFAKFENFF